MKSLAEGFRRYAEFTGRSTRIAFWEFVGITQTIMVILLLPAIYTLIYFFVYLNQQTEYLDFAVSLLIDPLHNLPTAAVNLRDIISRTAECYFAEPWETCPAAVWSLIVAGIWAIIIALPTLAATVRRLRDAGASLLWALPPRLACVPIPSLGQIGLILSLITLVECCRGSQLPPTPEQPRA